MGTVEKDRARLRMNLGRYEEENKQLLHALEEAKIEANELKKQVQICENKVHANLEVREDKISTQ